MSDIQIRKIILNQPDKNKLITVYIEIYKKSEKSYKRISTGVKIKASHWSKSKGEVSRKDDEHTEKNKLMQDKFFRIQDYVNRLDDSGFRYDVEKEFPSLVGFFPASRNKPIKTILSYMDEYIEYRQATNPKKGSWKEFLTVKNRIKSYCEEKNITLTFDNINFSFADDMVVWLNKKKYHTNTIHKHFGTFKTFLNHYYRKRDEISINLSDDFRKKEWIKTRLEYSEPNPLTEEEFNRFLTFAPSNKRLELTKDRFLLGCSSGLRYSDLFRIKKKNIKDGCIEISPAKTEFTKENNILRINLNPISSSILKKYDWDTSQLQISNQVYNKELKSISTELELGRKITSHNGRDTFITLNIQKGVDIPTIMSWTGHTKYETMRKYIKLTEEHKITMMNKGIGSFNPPYHDPEDDFEAIIASVE